MPSRWGWNSIALGDGMELRSGAGSLTRAPLVVAAMLVGCGGGGSSSTSAARAPSHAGQVWELDHANDRATGPAALLAFVNGLDVMVVDGNDIYTGTTLRHAQPGASGLRAVPLPNGLGAQLVASGDALELHFSSGEHVPLRKRTVPAAR